MRIALPAIHSPNPAGGTVHFWEAAGSHVRQSTLNTRAGSTDSRWHAVHHFRARDRRYVLNHHNHRRVSEHYRHGLGTRELTTIGLQTGGSDSSQVLTL